MFWKKKEIHTSADSRTILSMVMLQANLPFQADYVVKDFNNHYNNKIDEYSADTSSMAFTVSGEMIAIGQMDLPVPFDDIEETSLYAYNWQTVLEETKKHKSHLIVSIMNGSHDQVKRFRILTQVLSSVLRTTNAIGVYQGAQSLLISTNDYLQQAALMTNDYLPLFLWIYFGLRHTKEGNSGYTYGLKEFNKMELEIIDHLRALKKSESFYIISRITFYSLI